MDVRIRRGSVAILLAVAVAAPGGIPAGAAGLAAIEPCTILAASPNFAQDGTAFCAGVETATQGDATKIAFFSTTDRGRTWTKQPAANLLPNNVLVNGVPVGNKMRLGALLVSPTYATDQRVMLLASNVVYVSTDLGRTFVMLTAHLSGDVAVYVPVGPVVALRNATIVHTTAQDSDGEPAGTRVEFAETVDAVTRAHTPVIGTAGRDSDFVVPPVLANDGDAYVVNYDRTTLFGCDMRLRCSTVLWQVAAPWHIDRILLGPDFPKHRTLFASLVSATTPSRTQWWRSLDGGKTFHRWTAIERLQADFGQVSFGLASVPGTRDLYLRISGNGDTRPNGTPYERLYRSRDDGTTWTLVSFGRSRYQRGARGSMPVNRPHEANPDFHPDSLVATGDRLFMLGETVEAGRPVQSFFCSADGGRSWRRTC